jgi:hypothetical protein
MDLHHSSPSKEYRLLSPGGVKDVPEAVANDAGCNIANVSGRQGSAKQQVQTDILGDASKPHCRRCENAGISCKYTSPVSFLDKNIHALPSSASINTGYSSLRV